MKPKILLTGFVTLSILMIMVQIYFREKSDQLSWIQDFNYNENQIHDFAVSFLNPCPSISVGLNGIDVELLFDTGCGAGLFLTTAIEGKINYQITGRTTEYNADGTFRGEGKNVLISRMTVFNDEYPDVPASLAEWKMYGFFRNNGGIGLEYFDNKIITLDYKHKKIAVSNEAIDYDKLQKDKYNVLPLLSSDADKENELLFFQGEVNGLKSTIYLDTGSSRSFINVEEGTGRVAGIKMGNKMYQFSRRKLKNDKIGLQGHFEYPVRFAINSDILKTYHFVVTIDKIQNNLILYQNKR